MGDDEEEQTRIYGNHQPTNMHYLRIVHSGACDDLVTRGVSLTPQQKRFGISRFDAISPSRLRDLFLYREARDIEVPKCP